MAKIPDERVPDHQLERELAIICCRLNSWRRPLTGEHMTKDEREWHQNMAYERFAFLAPDEAVQWMWMNGRAEWANDDQA